MEPMWSPELDEKLIELHGRKLNLAFMTSWLRRPRADIVSRLAELGLAMRKASPGQRAIAGRAAGRPSARAAPHASNVPRLPVRPVVADRREPAFADAAQGRDANFGPMASASHLAMDRPDDDDDDGEYHLPTFEGCPPGHLMSEARIAALYHALSRNYG